MAQDMTPLDPAKTVRGGNLRNGRREIWEATSADGRWVYTREDADTTPWIVTDPATGRDVWFGTLSAARRWTATQPAAVTA